MRPRPWSAWAGELLPTLTPHIIINIFYHHMGCAVASLFASLVASLFAPLLK